MNAKTAYLNIVKRNHIPNEEGDTEELNKALKRLREAEVQFKSCVDKIRLLAEESETDSGKSLAVIKPKGNKE